MLIRMWVFKRLSELLCMLQRTKQQESRQKISLRPGLKDVTANPSKSAKNRRWSAQAASTASRAPGTSHSAIDFSFLLALFSLGVMEK